MRRIGTAFTLLLGTAAASHAAPPLVNPVTIPLPIGSTVHLTPIDQNGVPIPVAQCTLTGVLSVATVAKDATGFVLTSLTSGSSPTLGKIDCTDGVTHVLSSAFTVTVPNPPYAVTAVGDTMP